MLMNPSITAILIGYLVTKRIYHWPKAIQWFAAKEIHGFFYRKL